MLDNLETIRMARAMTTHAERRAKVVAGNVANADTPGYRAREVEFFSESYRRLPNPMRVTRAGHFGQGTGVQPRLRQDAGGRSPNGNSVSLEAEMVKVADLRREHNLSLAVYRSSLTMLRRALGQRG